MSNVITIYVVFTIIYIYVIFNRDVYLVFNKIEPLGLNVLYSRCSHENWFKLFLFLVI